MINKAAASPIPTPVPIASGEIKEDMSLRLSMATWRTDILSVPNPVTP